MSRAAGWSHLRRTISKSPFSALTPVYRQFIAEANTYIEEVMAKKRSCGFIDATESYQGETPASNMNTPVITSISSDTPACMELMESKDVKVGKKKYRATVEHTSTASEGGHTIHDTTYEVDYAAIILQRAMKWFMKGVADLDNQDVHFPDQSHGFSTVLANVHRAHPRISTSWRDDDDVVRLYEVSNYESAGVWIESSGEPCLVIWASFDDGTDCMRLLYTEQLVKRDKDVDDEGQWLILDTGTGEHLQDMGTYIKADGKAQGPLLSENETKAEA